MNPDLARDRESALAYDCEWCNAPAGTPCVRPDDMALRNIPAHLARLKAAGVAARSRVGEGSPNERVRPQPIPAEEYLKPPYEPPLDDYPWVEDEPTGWFR